MRGSPKDARYMSDVRKLESSANCLMMSFVVSTQYTSVTDRQTDGQTQRHSITPYA